MRRALVVAFFFAAAVLSSSANASELHGLLFSVDTPIVVSSIDTLMDSDGYDLPMLGLRKRFPTHSFVLSEFQHPRQFIYREHFALMDFNRVTGFFLGLGNEAFQNFGPHGEIGLHAGLGYGFADKRWEYLLGPEFRIPLESIDKHRADTSNHDRFFIPPTIAIGGEIHNITSTEDYWRAGKTENAAYAFFAREDFRDYFKLAGWNGYIAFRPRMDYEFRVEWRSDHYQSLGQEVYYGRFGGNKVLPTNPPVGEGEMHSFVLTSQLEAVHSTFTATPNLFGDTVVVEQLTGRSVVLQAELGHMPASDFGFNRYVLDARRFRPIVNGLNFDVRFRFEASTGDAPFQKLQFLGGPGSLPALYRKDLMGNRMLLLNTELRFSLMMLSSYFRAPDLNLVLYNDFGKIGIASNDEGIFSGFGFHGASSIVYNVGVGIGWTNGVQIGATWRTDVAETPRVLFRFQRPF